MTEPLLTPEGMPVPDFMPWLPDRYVPPSGWTAARQRDFIAALCRIGSVRAAAKVAGRTARSAYQLRNRSGAEHFSVAWDTAASIGRQSGYDAVIDRALHGEQIPVYRRGVQVGTRVRHNDQLLIATFNALNASVGKDRRALEEERYRLERWAVSLRRRELDLDNGVDEKRADAAFEHGVWLHEMRLKRRREKAAEIREQFRRTQNRQTILPRVRSL